MQCWKTQLQATGDMLAPWHSKGPWCLLGLQLWLVACGRGTKAAPDFSVYLHRILRNHTSHSCAGDTLSITCPPRTAIAVLSAFYGRRIPSEHLCPSPSADPGTRASEESTDCVSSVAVQKVMDECQDRRSCSIPVINHVFGVDPCPQTSKYLLVSYKCRPENHRNKQVCENERLRLACRNETVLAIYSATFGYRLHGSSHCPQESTVVQDIECLSPSALRRVSRKCHGRTNCSLVADMQNFGDPCFPGVRKHLRVSYTCVPRYLLEDIGQGAADPFSISDIAHGGWYTGPGVFRSQSLELFISSLEIYSQMQGLPERVALYFVSGICAGLVFLLCLFGLKSTLVRDVKGLFSELEDELKGVQTPGVLDNDADDGDNDDTASESSFRRLTRSYRTADMFSPQLMVGMGQDYEEDKLRKEIFNGDIWLNKDSSPYAIHKLKALTA